MEGCSGPDVLIFSCAEGEGRPQALGGAGEGAKFWMSVLMDVKNCGFKDKLDEGTCECSWFQVFRARPTIDAAGGSAPCEPTPRWLLRGRLRIPPARTYGSPFAQPVREALLSHRPRRGRTSPATGNQ